MTKLSAGDLAPGFSLIDQGGNPVALRDFKGQKVLVYFYPKADTPGCTIQACSVRDNRGELLGLGIHTLGISPDTPDEQRQFDVKFSLGFNLLSDPDHAVAASYGAWGERNLYGKKTEGIIRSAFLIGEDGRLLDVWYKVKPADMVPKARAALG
jgi:thioredoxin-dependent peroxiredoxin